jgi:hypothetical protein
MGVAAAIDRCPDRPPARRGGLRRTPCKQPTVDVALRKTFSKTVPDPAQVRRAIHCLKPCNKANLVFKSD